MLEILFHTEKEDEDKFNTLRLVVLTGNGFSNLLQARETNQLTPPPPKKLKQPPTPNQPARAA